MYVEKERYEELFICKKKWFVTGVGYIAELQNQKGEKFEWITSTPGMTYSRLNRNIYIPIRFTYNEIYKGVHYISYIKILK